MCRFWLIITLDCTWEWNCSKWKTFLTWRLLSTGSSAVLTNSGSRRESFWRFLPYSLRFRRKNRSGSGHWALRMYHQGSLRTARNHYKGAIDSNVSYWSRFAVLLKENGRLQNSKNDAFWKIVSAIADNREFPFIPKYRECWLYYTITFRQPVDWLFSQNSGGQISQVRD